MASLIVEPFVIPQPRLTLRTVGFKVTIPGNPGSLAPLRELLQERIDQVERRAALIEQEVDALVASHSARDFLIHASQHRPLRLERSSRGAASPGPQP